MFAIIAFVLAVLAGFNAHAGSVTAFDFLAFAVAALSLHLAYPYTPWRR